MDKDRKQKIEREIRKTMEPLDRGEPLPPAPYFYTRLQARLEERQRHGLHWSAVLKPALLTVLLALNAGTAISYLRASAGLRKPPPGSNWRRCRRKAFDLKATVSIS